MSEDDSRASYVGALSAASKFAEAHASAADKRYSAPAAIGNDDTSATSPVFVARQRSARATTTAPPAMVTPVRPAPVAESQHIRVSPTKRNNSKPVPINDPAPLIAAKDHEDAYWKGWLKKRHLGTHGSKRRYCVVKPTSLMYFASPDDEVPKGTIHFHDIGVGFDAQFTFITEGAIYIFTAETEKEHDIWMNVLSRAISSINK